MLKNLIEGEKIIMTILIGLKFNNNALIMADCRRSKTDIDGNFLQIESDDINKVHVINDSTILALGGISAVVDLTLKKVKAKTNNDTTINQIIEICKTSYKEACRELFPNLFRWFSFFSRKNKKRADAIFVSFMLAGINKEDNTPFLVQFESHVFQLTVSNSIVNGEGNNEVIDFMNLKKLEPDPVTCSAQAICEVSKMEKKISPNSYGIAINDRYEIEIFNFNNKGILKINS